MGDSEDFQRGYADGYRSVTGSNALPTQGTEACPAGKTWYEAGFEKGVEYANERGYDGK